jgi:hypothetical protein
MPDRSARSKPSPRASSFVADVSGAVSYYAKEMYLHPSGLLDTVCGNPVASAEGPLGADAEFLFARTWCGTYEALAAPVLWAGPRGLSTGELQRRRTRTLISGSALRAGGGWLWAAKSVVRGT